MAERIVAALSLLALIGCSGRAPVAGSCLEPVGTIVVELVEADGDDRGSVAFALYDTEASFDGADAPLRTERLDCAAGTCRWLLEGLPCGSYAIKSYRDLDEDGELDRGAFGAPTEPYGFSRDARGRFGPPSWGDAAFRFDGNGVTLSIELR